MCTTRANINLVLSRFMTKARPKEQHKLEERWAFCWAENMRSDFDGSRRWKWTERAWNVLLRKREEKQATTRMNFQKIKMWDNFLRLMLEGVRHLEETDVFILLFYNKYITWWQLHIILYFHVMKIDSISVLWKYFSL